MKLIVSFFLALNLCCIYAEFAQEDNNVNRVGPERHLVEGSPANATIQSYTIVLTLYREGKELSRCGGAKLDKNWYITAAECLDRKKYDTVRLTSSNAPDSKFLHTFYPMNRSSTFFIHPKYDQITKLNNIALIKNADEFYKPPPIVDMPGVSDRTQLFTGRIGVISAWLNTTNSSGLVQWDVTYQNATVQDLAWCKQIYTQVKVEDYHICVFGQRLHALTSDDIGAPLVINKYGRVTLIGIASSIRRFNDYQPHVFVRTSPYIEWVSYVTRKSVLP